MFNLSNKTREELRKMRVDAILAGDNKKIKKDFLKAKRELEDKYWSIFFKDWQKTLKGDSLIKS